MIDFFLVQDELAKLHRLPELLGLGVGQRARRPRVCEVGLELLKTGPWSRNCLEPSPARHSNKLPSLTAA